MKKASVLFPGLFFVLLMAGVIIIRRDSFNLNNNNQKSIVNITVSKKRVIQGDTLFFKVLINALRKPDQVDAFLVKPAKGIEKLAIEKDPKNKKEYSGKIIPGNDCTDGFYGITVVCKYGRKQIVGKGSFLSGKIILDFAIMANFADSGTVIEQCANI